MPRVTFKKGAKVERIEKHLDNPAAALEVIGVLMVAESQKAFKAQSFGGKPWAPRAPINVFGLINDFHLGRAKPAARRFQTRPALQDTGWLAGSITSKVKGDSVEVGTNVEYAEVHLTGGTTESKPLTKAVRASIWKWLKKQDVGLKRRLGWLLNRKFADETLKQEVPARPFLGITPELRKTVSRMVGVSIAEAK